MKAEFILLQPGPGTQHRLHRVLWSPGQGSPRGPCSFLQVPGAAVTDHRLAEGQFKAAWILAAVFLGAVFTAKAQRTLGTSPCKVLGGLQEQHWREGGVCGLQPCFLSHESGNCN